MVVTFSNYCFIGDHNLGVLEHTMVVVLVVVLVVLSQRALKHFRVLALDWQHWRRVHVVFTLFTFVSACLFFYQASLVSGHLIHCTLNAWDHINGAINLLFWMRLILVVVEKQEVPLVAAVVDTWLMVHSCWEFYLGTHLYGYQFLSVLRFTYPETREVFTLLVRLYFGYLWQLRVSLVAGLFVTAGLMAGVLQTVEEWRTDEGTHPDAGGQITLPRTFADYIYMSVITLTTVGYGDLVPSTACAKVLVVVFIFLFVGWLAESFTEINKMFSDLFCYHYNSIPRSYRGSRIVILGCNSQQKLKCFLNGFQWETRGTQPQIIVLLDELLELEVSDFREKFFNYLNVLIFCKTITEEVLQECFPFQYYDITKRPQDCLVVLNDTQTSDIPAADSKVFTLVDMAKRRIPSLVVIVQVLLWETQEALTVMRGWGPNDRVVCLEQLTAGLVAQNVVADGALSVLGNVISPNYFYGEKLCDVSGTGTHKLAPINPNGARMVLGGNSVTLGVQPGHQYETNELFSEAAINHYFREQSVLLGYRRNGTWCVLEREVPAGADRILLVPLYDSQEEQSTDSSNTSRFTLRQDRLPEAIIMNPSKKVGIIQDTHSGMLRYYLNKYPHLQVTHCDEANTVVYIETPQPLERAICNLHIKKGELMKRKPTSRLITNVSQCYKTSIIDCVFTSFVRQTFLWPDLSAVWLSIVTRADIVEVQIKGECWYGEIFHYLANTEGLICLGVMKQYNNWLIPISNPRQEYHVTDKDSIIALKFLC